MHADWLVPLNQSEVNADVYKMDVTHKIWDNIKISRTMENITTMDNIVTLAAEAKHHLHDIGLMVERRLPFVELREYINTPFKMSKLWPLMDNIFYRHGKSHPTYHFQRWLVKYLQQTCEMQKTKKEEEREEEDINILYLEKILKDLLLEADTIEWMIHDLYANIEESQVFHDAWLLITHVPLDSWEADTNQRVSTKNYNEEVKSHLVSAEMLNREKRDLYFREMEKMICHEYVPYIVREYILDVFSEKLLSNF